MATSSLTPLNDNAWHTVTCVLTSSSVTMYVDGAYRSRKTGSAGTIDNSIPMTVGGKINCDQVTITCDYFSGQLDYVKITKGPNLAPMRRSQDRASRWCVRSTGRRRAIRTAPSWRTHGTSETGRPRPGVNPTHAFSAPGCYTVTLNALDDDGVPDPKVSTVVVALPDTQPPVADFSSSCVFLVCGFDSSASVDPDGSVASVVWSFADGARSVAAAPSHTFAVGGSYAVTLTVTDKQGATGSVTKTVTVAAQPMQSSVGFVGSRFSAASSNNASVTVPATAAGQRLVMVLSINSLSPTLGAPTGVTGWALLDTVVAKDMATTVWTKVAAAGDAGTAVHVPLSVVAKYTLTVGAYSGVDPAGSPVFARSGDVTVHDTARVTPDVAVPAGSWVVSYWADKSSMTTAWTPAGSVTTRAAGCGADGGRICSALADSGAPVPAGSYGHITASTDAPSDKATMWPVVLAPAP